MIDRPISKKESGRRCSIIGSSRGDDPAAALAELAPADLRPEIQPDLWPRPKLEDWPTGREDLGQLIDRLDPTDPDRLGEDWSALVRVCEDDAAAPMIRVTRGCFQALGIYDWDRFYRVMVMFLDRPEMIERLMAVHGELHRRPGRPGPGPGPGYGGRVQRAHRRNRRAAHLPGDVQRPYFTGPMSRSRKF